MEVESSKTSEELTHLQFENSDDTRNAVKILPKSNFRKLNDSRKETSRKRS